MLCDRARLKDPPYVLLVNDFTLVALRVEVRDLERPHRVQRQEECLVDRALVTLFPQILSDLPEYAKDLRPIESLTLTVFTVAHG